ncbi:hypothetical protein EJB05_09496, partial [Eragrostis curvula]
MEAARRSTVCATGAGGFLASWLVKLLLSTGRYAVRGTARDPGMFLLSRTEIPDEAASRVQQQVPIRTLLSWRWKAPARGWCWSRLTSLNYGSVASAVAGCEGVFHVASPVPYGRCSDPEADVIAPSVTGTLNVLRACHEAKVKRVVLVSSVAAVFNNPSWPKGKAFDEDSWSDEEYCRKIEGWYFLSKISAEREAFAYAAETGLAIVSVCPSMVIGPLLQSTVPTSVKYFLGYIKGGELLPLGYMLLLEASGRYLCSVSDIMNIVRTSCPTHSYPKRFVEVEDNITYNTDKLQKLGWSFRPIDETIRDSIECYRDLGILN